MAKTIIASLCLIIIYLMALPMVSAQNTKSNGNIQGTIRNEQQSPVSYLPISLYNAADTLLIKGTLTTETGSFTFNGLAAGIYLIAAGSAAGKPIFHGPFVLTDAASTLPTLNITLPQQIRQLNTVNITGRKALIERKNDKTIINVANSILAAGNTAMDILAKAPGVSVDQEGNVSLRGKRGINVMIDDKVSYLSTAQMAEMLRSTSGSSIQSIELISGPSAKYDAAGSGGIINIKLKKNSSYGTNGTLTAGAGYGLFYKSNAGLTLNNRSKNLNIFGLYNYSNNKDTEYLNINRSSSAGEEATYFGLQGRDIYLRKNNSYKIGADYYLNDRNILGFVINGYHNNNTIDAQYKTLIGSQPNLTDSSITAFNPGKSKYNNISYNLNYKSVIDTAGQELNFDADYSQFHSSNEIVYNNTFENASGTTYRNPYIYKNATPSTVKIWTGKVDYSLPLSKKTKLETGAKSSYVRTDNDFQFEDYNEGMYKNDPLKSNRFIYKESIYAAYVNLQKELNKTTIQAGLRAELTHSEGNAVNSQHLVKRSYLNFFPSITLNQQLSANNEAGISYHRRVDRPDYQSLNPFIYYTDLYTFYQGNPLLNPQYTNAFELTYNYQKTLNITLGYSHTSDVITTTLASDTIKKTLLITDQNLAEQETYNLNITRPAVFSPWWSTTNDVTLYYNKYSSPNLMGAPFDSHKLSYILNTTQTFQINSTLNAELTAIYHSSQVYGTYAVKPLYGIDLGISKSFANNRANVKIAANDVFNLQKARISSAIPMQDYRLYQKPESRVFRLTFSYNFGSTLIKAMRDRLNGAEAEQSRVKTGN